MRRFKFRMWNATEKQMCFEPNYYGSAIHVGQLVTSPDHIWMQYIGLLDKNGKEIYEGDILKGEDYKFDDHIFEVKYMKIKGCGCCEDSGIGFNLYLNDAADEVEVIGNRFENPELLEELTLNAN